MLKTFGIHVVWILPFFCFLVLFQLWRCCCCCSCCYYCWHIHGNSGAFVCIAYKWNLFIFCDLAERRARKNANNNSKKSNRRSLTNSFTQIKHMRKNEEKRGREKRIEKGQAYSRCMAYLHSLAIRFCSHSSATFRLQCDSFIFPRVQFFYRVQLQAFGSTYSTFNTNDLLFWFISFDLFHF